MFETLLIANRGEIACRIMRTCRRLGVRTVAVHSTVDRDALFVRSADVAVEIGGPAPSDSYLRAERIIAAARRTGAQAIHPGYGFLSENAEFAEACAAASLRFIGPSPTAMRKMGLKDAAKALMEQAKVPVVPGYHGVDQAPQTLKQAAARIGYPVLIKAVAGGGGKGMRRVEGPAAFDAALASAKREASQAFGDDRVLIEKYLERPRHIEVQVFGDSSGDVVHLYERDCSLQRRHQKVLEEAPAPGMPVEVRRAMGEAAVRAGRAIGYEGAGTVEFIADARRGLTPDSFYFMEMNTRLQVEHPVTEMVTGIDLVEWQLRVALGERLPWKQSEVPLRGHAIEARIYAEDPQRDYLPQAGSLVRLRTPCESDHVRVDTGVVEGDTVGAFYDPMIGKLAVWDVDRASAVRRLRRALEECEIAGLQTNVALLAQVAAHPAFVAGDVHTGFLSEHGPTLLAPRPDLERKLLILSIAAHLEARAQANRMDPSPWARTDGFRINADRSDWLRFARGEETSHVEVTFRATETQLALPWGSASFSHPSLCGDRVSCLVDGERLHGSFCRQGARTFVTAQGMVMELDYAGERFADAEATAGSGVIRAPMPGKVIAVHAEVGQRVSKGQALLGLLAMKMEHTLLAPFDGTVSELRVRVLSQVDEGSTLLVLQDTQEAVRGE